MAAKLILENATSLTSDVCSMQWSFALHRRRMLPGVRIGEEAVIAGRRPLLPRMCNLLRLLEEFQQKQSETETSRSITSLITRLFSHDISRSYRFKGITQGLSCLGNFHLLLLATVVRQLK